MVACLRSKLFEGIKGVDTMADDIIIYSPTREAHDDSLRKVLETAEGIQPDPRKVSAITNMPHPENWPEVQRFLGMVTFLAKWIPGCS